MKDFYVLGITHVDLAWKRGRDEMSEMLEIVVVRLLDCLESDPDFRYVLEQAAHFRELQKRRPDLIARLKPFIAAGRLEVVGAMASTLETNLPGGECFVRNQQMGLAWVRENWGAEVETGWLIDTFGVHAQVPQILRGFGFTQLMANRFGGRHTHDLFRARGLDGSEIPVAGWGTYAAHIRRENLSERFCANWDDINIIFEQADKLSGPGPFLVIPYTENEMLVSRRPGQIAAQRNREREGESWQMATPREYFAAVEQSGRELPVVGGDLNPEFTGCFSLRQPIRLRNRVVENRLLEAEKWAALAGLSAAGLSAEKLEAAWWELHYVQFHDVFTGSHPTPVFHDVMKRLDAIEAAAEDVLQEAFARLAPSEIDDETTSVVAFNGLPWTRRDIVEMALPAGFEGVSRVSGAGGETLPFAVRDNRVRIAAEIPAVGFASLSLENGPASSQGWQSVETATLENQWIRFDFDTQNGLAHLIWKPTGAVLLENAGDWLVAQRDDGNFQIENPTGAEVAASSGTLRLETLETALGQTVRLSGEFPDLTWAETGNFLRFSAEFFLPRERAEVRLALGLDWRGEATRVRLSVSTQIDSASGIYEIPFGVVSRKPYSPRTNAKGEWPAHRFVALEDGKHGLALINTGVAGVEVSGGTLYTTLLRAPKSSYVGMERDETSSQHGHHDYTFSLVPYAGCWADAGIAKRAQELNSPVLTDFRNAPISPSASPGASFLALEPDNVVLSCIKPAQDGSGQLIVRLYETAGRATDAVLQMPTAHQIFSCDLREIPGEEIDARRGELRLRFQPFEIKSFRLEDK